uniref:Putative FAD-dependent oxidoreductase n=1 Tax=Streptomyces versipellis TaxID=67375 RepID=A0A0B6VP96_9ACTN|nr:putative FAD-dependent oxidoreductase [Streptomyces versipellis]
MSSGVVVVGGGTVGLMLAHELGLAGVDTVLVERAERGGKEAPALALNAGVVELLTLRGFMDTLREVSIDFPAAQWGYLWLDPGRLRDPHPCTIGLHQPVLEAHLRAAVRRLGVDVRIGQEVVGLSQDEDGAVVEVDTGSGRESIRCRYVVGCDGKFSTVRELAGMDYPGEEFPYYGIHGEVVVESGSSLLGHLQPVFYPAGNFIVSPPDPEVLGVVTGKVAPPADGRLPLRILTGEFGTEPPDRRAPVTVEELRVQAKRITGKDVDLGEPRWLERWDYTVRQTTRYRNGRVFLAGDAAHVHFPLGGVALSTGLDDAVNLGWKLAADINGWAPKGLLDTYHDERHPAAERVCGSTQAQVFLLHPLEKAEPLREILTELVEFEDVNEYFVKLAGGLEPDYAMEYEGEDRWAEPHPLLGSRLADHPLRAAAGATSVSRQLYAGRGVLLDLSEGALPVRDVAGWADRVDVVAVAATEAIDARAVLLRPDGRVAWAQRQAGDTAGLRTALGAWFGEPKP